MKTIVFDFDGTIVVPNADIVVDILNGLSGKYKYGKFTPEEVLTFKGMGARELLRKLGIRWWQAPLFFHRGKKLLEKNSRQLKVVSGMLPVLRGLKKKTTIGILTSHPRKGIVAFLKKHKIAFDFVITDVAPFRKHRKLKFLQHKYSIIYAGDEVRDIEAARKAHVPVVAVTWGYNSREALMGARPTFVAETPKDLIKIVKFFEN